MAGRPRIEPDLTRLDSLPIHAITKGAIAAHLDMCLDTLETREKESPEFSAIIKKTVEAQRAKARSKRDETVWGQAQSGDITAGIWYDKSRLGLSDKQSITIDGDLDIAFDRSKAFSGGDATDQA